jgi:stage IV sporulation protein FB
MAWQDRPYYRDRAPARNPLLWLLYGSVPLFTVFGIRVRAHASLVLYVGLVLLLGLGPGFAWQDKVLSMAMLFVLVLLHEFGHCFAARWLGGSADDILMHPLGGLAMAQPPRHPWPTFLTVLAGPSVNLLICVITGSILWITTGWVPRDPFHFIAPHWGFSHWYDLLRYDYWIYELSLMLLVFNLLPIFPLDGGQMVQTMLWPKLGYYRSMLISCVVGMVASVLGAMIAFASRDIGLALLAMMGFICCFSFRRQLLAIGPEEYADETDYSAAYDNPAPVKRRRKVSRRAVKKARRRAQQEAIQQRRIDTILAKVSAQGLASLTWAERRALHKATDQQRKRDLELTR